MENQNFELPKKNYKEYSQEEVKKTVEEILESSYALNDDLHKTMFDAIEAGIREKLNYEGNIPRRYKNANGMITIGTALEIPNDRWNNNFDIEVTMSKRTGKKKS